MNSNLYKFKISTLALYSFIYPLEHVPEKIYRIFTEITVQIGQSIQE